MANYATKEKLKQYLFDLPPNYISRVIPYDIDFEKIIAQENRLFREVVWDLILSNDILSLCGFSQKDGLILKLRNNEFEPIKDEKLFIAYIFATLNGFYFEYRPDIYKYFVIKKMHKLSNLYDELEIIENGLSKTSTYKTDKKKKNLPREDNQKNLRNKLKDRINEVSNLVINKDFDKIFWSQTKKRNEKIIVSLLYDCFKRAVNRISKEDIFHCISKVTLLLGTYKHSKAVRNYEPITQNMFEKEFDRVKTIYKRLK
jgi:hypothetical protein